MAKDSMRFNDKVLKLYKKYFLLQEEEYVDFVNDHSRHALFETIKKALKHKANIKTDKAPDYFAYLKKIHDLGYPALHLLIFKN